MKILIATLIGFFALAMNQIPIKNQEDNKMPVTKSADLPLQNTHWKLIELAGKKMPINATAKEMFIVLKNDSTVTGNGGCNAFSGDYSLGKNNKIFFGELVRTNVLCPGIDFERKYLNAISATDHYQIMGNMLSLQNKFTSVAKFVGMK
ncbi:MAG: META domain-containing protein [Ginsengibacter sp.]